VEWYDGDVAQTFPPKPGPSREQTIQSIPTILSAAGLASLKLYRIPRSATIRAALTQCGDFGGVRRRRQKRSR
jgi:hypothetical protein